MAIAIACNTDFNCAFSSDRGTFELRCDCLSQAIELPLRLRALTRRPSPGQLRALTTEGEELQVSADAVATLHRALKQAVRKEMVMLP